MGKLIRGKSRCDWRYTRILGNPGHFHHINYPPRNIIHLEYHPEASVRSTWSIQIVPLFPFSSLALSLIRGESKPVSWCSECHSTARGKISLELARDWKSTGQRTVPILAGTCGGRCFRVLFPRPSHRQIHRRGPSYRIVETRRKLKYIKWGLMHYLKVCRMNSDELGTSGRREGCCWTLVLKRRS